MNRKTAKYLLARYALAQFKKWPFSHTMHTENNILKECKKVIFRTTKTDDFAVKARFFFVCVARAMRRIRSSSSTSYKVFTYCHFSDGDTAHVLRTQGTKMKS